MTVTEDLVGKLLSVTKKFEDRGTIPVHALLF